MDNNLPPYQSKLARLNVECADPTMLRDCIAGQKWKCINEDGRWRKHKCKFHREVQNHLAEVNKYLSAQSKRNCACFTPDGVVYTKIKSERDVFQPKQKRTNQRHNGRYRRETSLEADEIYINQVPPEFIDLLRMDEVVENLQNTLMNQSEQHSELSRKKRDADYISQTLDDLHKVLGNIEKKYANSSANGPVQCFVEPTGKVNCSTIVYENEKAWKQSRVQIDMLIRVLKNKITNLKDIKRHLKEHRPMNMTYDEENYENFSSSIEDVERSEEVDEVTKAAKRKTAKPTSNPHRHPTGTERKKKQRTTSTTEDGTSSFTTEKDELASSSVMQEESSSVASTTPAAVPSQRPRNRTKVQRTSTTSPRTTTADSQTSEDFSSFSFTSERYDDLSISELPSSTELLRTTTAVQENFDSKSVTIDATVIEPRPRHHKHRQNGIGNGVGINTNVTDEYDQHRHVPADCYCEPEYER